MYNIFLTAKSIRYVASYTQKHPYGASHHIAAPSYWCSLIGFGAVGMTQGVFFFSGSQKNIGRYTFFEVFGNAETGDRSTKTFHG